MTTAPLADPAEIARRLGDGGREALLALAWSAVRAAVRGQSADPAELAAAPQVELFGAFVTLTTHDVLRGCIGSVGRIAPAAELVADAGGAAAVSDPRFPPVRPAELDQLDLEVSLLTPLEWLAPETLPGAVRVGVHGLVVERPPARGLLLPQVASERQWDAERFLDETCRKAGLPKDAWRTGARVARFAALVLHGERRPNT